MRVLFASTSGMGHFNPLVPFIDAAAARGDEVLLFGPPALEPALRATGHPYRIGAAPPEDEAAEVRERLKTASPGEAAALVDGELFGRLYTAAMLPAAEQACREWQPDLVLHEPCEYSSVVAAERERVPHAQVGISLARIESAALGMAAPALDAHVEGLADRLRAAPYLTRFPPSLDPSPYRATRRFRAGDGGDGGGGGVADAEASAGLPDWWPGREGPLIYVSFGTMAGGHPVGTAAYRVAMDAVAEIPARVLLTVGRRADISALGPIPDNVHVEAWVPQAEVLGSAALVLCHGGSGTSFGALAAGVPLVVVPLFADQPANAQLILESGAGLAVLPSGKREGAARVPASEDVPGIRAAVESVLGDGSYRRAAGRIAAEMSELPTAGALLAELAAGLGAGLGAAFA